MPINFPSFDITGIRPSRWYAAPLDYPKITQSFEFEDGGKGFNEVADNAPRHWEYGHTGLSFADAQQFDDFYNLVRLSQPFDFKDKYGATWHNVYVESYTRNHDAHKSWSITVTFHLVNYDGSFTPAPGPPPPLPDVPTGLRLVVMPGGEIEAIWDWGMDTPLPSVPVMLPATGVTDLVIHWNWNASTSDAPIVGYDLEIAENSGFTTGLRTINLGNVLTYADVHRTASTQYWARVRAHDEVPHTSAYSSSVNTTTETLQFAPTDVADLWTWLDPTDFFDQGLVDGHHIAIWHDSSGNSRHATASGASEPIVKLSIVNSWPVARFEGGLFHFMNLPSMAALTAGEAFIVIKANAQPSANFAKSGLWALGTAGSLYTFNGDGKIYDGFGSTTRKDTITPSLDTSAAFRVYSVYSASGDWQNYLNGVSQFSTGTNTVSFPAGPAIGYEGGSANFDGDIAEFLLFSRKLTGTERTNIINFLMDKYGL